MTEHEIKSIISEPGLGILMDWRVPCQGRLATTDEPCNAFYSTKSIILNNIQLIRISQGVGNCSIICHIN